jgi:invasion protein IalB
MKRTLMLLSMIATALVFGTCAVEAAGDPRAMQLSYDSWTRMCFGKSNCFVGAGARGACFPSGGGVSIVTDDKNMSLHAILATKRVLESALSVQIDQGEPILIPHLECSGLICSGKVQVDSKFIDLLRHSQRITITATDTAGQNLNLSLSLTDFAAAFDGPERDPPKVTERTLTTEKFKELEQRQEEERKALLCKE